MATIVQRTVSGAPNSYDQGVLLEYGEAFLYPIPAELQDWNELRIGLRHGLYPWTGSWNMGGVWPNYMAQQAATIQNSTPGDLKNAKYFFGLKNSNNYLMPFETGDSRFLGLGLFSGDRGINIYPWDNTFTTEPLFIRYYNSASSEIDLLSAVYTSGATLGDRAAAVRFNTPSIRSAQLFCDAQYLSQTGKYCEMIALHYRKVSGTAVSFGVWKDAATYPNSHGVGYKTTQELRSFVNSINTADVNKYFIVCNGFHYTNSGDPNGSVIPMPDALFIYLSHTGCRYILYDFVIEKTS